MRYAHPAPIAAQRDRESISRALLTRAVVAWIGRDVVRLILRCALASGVAQWLACWAHNPKVRGSRPRSAILLVGEPRAANWPRVALAMLRRRFGFVRIVYHAIVETMGRARRFGNGHAVRARVPSRTQYCGDCVCERV